MSSKIDYGEVLFELKDGTEYASLHADAFRAAMRERDMLRAEREVWGNIAQERNDLRAENERLRAENATLTDHNDSLQAAVRKLNRLLEAALAGPKE